MSLSRGLNAQNRELTEAIGPIDQTIKTLKKNDASDVSLGRVLLQRGKLLGRAGQPEAAARDWRDAHAMLLLADGAEDRRVLELAKLLAR